MANLGPIPVPDALVPVLPYIKGVVAALGVIATVLTVVLGAGTPAFVYVVISAATLLGVFTVPNKQVKDIITDGFEAAGDAESALNAAKTGDVTDASADLHKAQLAANGALGGAEGIIKGIDPVLQPTPPIPPKPGVLPSEAPTPPQPVKPKDEPPHPPASGVLT